MDNENMITEVDLNAVDVSRQLLAPGAIQLELKKAEAVSTKDGQGTNLKLSFVNVRPERYEDGETAPAGAVFINHNILATPKGKMTRAQVQRALGELIQAVGGIAGAKDTNLSEWVPSLQGRVCNAQIAVEEEKRDKLDESKVYPRKNKISYFIIPKRS